MTKVNSWNEWDPVKHVIVGRIDSRMVGAPEAGMVLDLPELGLRPGEWTPIPDPYLEKATEQMESFAPMLANRGIRVDRPTSMDDRQYVRTPDWECSHMFGTMPPRDILMAYGHEILEATMSQRARWFEFLAYKPLLEQYFKEDPNLLWEAAPKPRLRRVLRSRLLGRLLQQVDRSGANPTHGALRVPPHREGTNVRHGRRHALRQGHLHSAFGAQQSCRYRLVQAPL